MDLAIQAEIFMVLLLTGGLLGFVFDFYRVLRGIHKPRGIATAAGDLMFWIIATGITGSSLLYSNGGELRLYIFLALAVGALVYFKVLSRTCIRIIIYFLRGLGVGVYWLKMAFCYVVIKPLLFPARLLVRPAVYSARRLRDWFRRLEEKDEKPPL